MGKIARPSDERRATLKQTVNSKIPHLSNLTPIQRYYALSIRILKNFYIAIEKNKLDEAYIFGLRFAQFSTQVLPTHDYYKVSQREYVQLRKENKNDLTKVIDKLENVVERMDFEELEKREIRRREEKAMRLIRLREDDMQKEAEERAATQALLDRLNMLDNIGPVPTGVIEKKEKQKQKQPKSQEDELAELEDEEEEDTLPIGDLPFPIPYGQGQEQQQQMLPPPSYDALKTGAVSPPSYDALMQHKQQTMDYRQDSIMNLRPSSSRSIMSAPIMDGFVDSDSKGFINPLQGPAGPLVPASLVEHGQVTNKIPPLPFSTLKHNARGECFNLRAQKKIEIFSLGTYQGRNKHRDSTNGCTVISPLVAVNHLVSEGAGISDIKIEEVIDEIAPSILSRVRNKLGLSGHALIIPSDVHDYLVDEKILKQEMFVGVCGGNVLDSTHVGEFLNLLESGEDSQSNAGSEEKKDMTKKVAAALFFHEHVVSILKVVLADGTMWYDLVDSMPTITTASNGQEKRSATRTRCKNRQSLESLLYWYACEKFSPADSKYIDANEWDDNMCDFDPRVFQGFVWKE